MDKSHLEALGIRGQRCKTQLESSVQLNLAKLI